MVALILHKNHGKPWIIGSKLILIKIESYGPYAASLMVFVGMEHI